MWSVMKSPWYLDYKKYPPDTSFLSVNMKSQRKTDPKRPKPYTNWMNKDYEYKQLQDNIYPKKLDGNVVEKPDLYRLMWENL